eukprot:jgi/Hompol1/2229/HPOL_002867-RA
MLEPLTLQWIKKYQNVTNPVPVFIAPHGVRASIIPATCVPPDPIVQLMSAKPYVRISPASVAAKNDVSDILEIQMTSLYVPRHVSVAQSLSASQSDIVPSVATPSADLEKILSQIGEFEAIYEGLAANDGDPDAPANTADESVASAPATTAPASQPSIAVPTTIEKTSAIKPKEKEAVGSAKHSAVPTAAPSPASFTPTLSKNQPLAPLTQQQTSPVPMRPSAASKQDMDLDLDLPISSVANFGNLGMLNLDEVADDDFDFFEDKKKDAAPPSKSLESLASDTHSTAASSAPATTSTPATLLNQPSTSLQSAQPSAFQMSAFEMQMPQSVTTPAAPTPAAPTPVSSSHMHPYSPGFSQFIQTPQHEPATPVPINAMSPGKTLIDTTSPPFTSPALPFGSPGFVHFDHTAHGPYIVNAQVISPHAALQSDGSQDTTEDYSDLLMPSAWLPFRFHDENSNSWIPGLESLDNSTQNVYSQLGAGSSLVHENASLDDHHRSANGSMAGLLKIIKSVLEEIEDTSSILGAAFSNLAASSGSGNGFAESGDVLSRSSSSASLQTEPRKHATVNGPLTLRDFSDLYDSESGFAKYGSLQLRKKTKRTMDPCLEPLSTPAILFRHRASLVSANAKDESEQRVAASLEAASVAKWMTEFQNEWLANRLGECLPLFSNINQSIFSVQPPSSKRPVATEKNRHLALMVFIPPHLHKVYPGKVCISWTDHRGELSGNQTFDIIDRQSVKGAFDHVVQFVTDLVGARGFFYRIVVCKIGEMGAGETDDWIATWSNYYEKSKQKDENLQSLHSFLRTVSLAYVWTAIDAAPTSIFTIANHRVPLTTCTSHHAYHASLAHHASASQYLPLATGWMLHGDHGTRISLIWHHITTTSKTHDSRTLYPIWDIEGRVATTTPTAHLAPQPHHATVLKDIIKHIHGLHGLCHLVPMFIKTD